jgi:hypothetical protein
MKITELGVQPQAGTNAAGKPTTQQTPAGSPPASNQQKQIGAPDAADPVVAQKQKQEQKKQIQAQIKATQAQLKQLQDQLRSIQ